MDIIGLLLSISIIIGGLYSIFTGQASLTKSSRPLRYKIIGRFVGLLFLIGGLLFLANDLELGHELRGFARHNLEAGILDDFCYFVGDFLDDFASAGAFIVVLVGIVITVIAPKEKPAAVPVPQVEEAEVQSMDEGNPEE